MALENSLDPGYRGVGGASPYPAPVDSAGHFTDLGNPRIFRRGSKMSGLVVHLRQRVNVDGGDPFVAVRPIVGLLEIGPLVATLQDALDKKVSRVNFDSGMRPGGMSGSCRP